jgi:chromosome segregation ATPase
LKVRAAVFKGDSGNDSKARALRAIQQLGRKFHSTALVSLAYRASADPFGKVRSMVEDMIAKLMQEAAEEANQKAFCDSELSKTKKSQDNKEAKIEKLDARIAKANAAVAELTEGVATLSQEIADIDAAVADWTSTRSKEKAVFATSEKDFSESEEACAAALEVLREYYEGGSLAQLDAKVAGKAAVKGDGSGIIGVLELAESDFAKNLAEVRAAESAEVDAYNKVMEDNKLSKATKEVERKGKESEVKSLKSALSSSTEDKSGISTELDAVLQYLAELKPQCETNVPSYAERKAAREAEIDGLKEALTILEA